VDQLARIRENIRTIAESRIKGHLSIEQLEESVASLKKDLRYVFESEKSTRIERARLTSERNLLKSKSLQLRKLRVLKEDLLSQRKTALREVRGEESGEVETDVGRLEYKLRELESELDVLQESFRVHSRDRFEAMKSLMYATEDLQDLLTEALLFRIQLLASDKDSGLGRIGLAGVTAELLGRLLVLEREQAQTWGLLMGIHTAEQGKDMEKPDLL
jgi:chromosome segregation ATPase